jgi:hypothetical protein
MRRQSMPYIHTHTCSEIVHLYTATIVHFPHIHQLLPSPPRDLVWYPLLHQGLVSSFNGVHLVSGSGHTGSEVVDTGCASHFEYVVLAAQPKS